MKNYWPNRLKAHGFSCGKRGMKNKTNSCEGLSQIHIGHVTDCETINSKEHPCRLEQENTMSTYHTNSYAIGSFNHWANRDFEEYKKIL